MGIEFSYPKPTRLIDYLIRAATSAGDLVLDFFAGSGTTGEAAMNLGTQFWRSRKFILVQLPQLSDIAGYPSIAELTKERLRRAGRKIKDENPMFAGDIGFRVFKLDSSNIREWEPNRDDLEGALQRSIEHLRTARSEADVLYELLLKLGLDLCVPIEARKIATKAVHSIAGGVLLACLSEANQAGDDVEPLALGIVEWHKDGETRRATQCAVFRDSAFADDVAKTNMAAILEQHGIANVRSL